MRFLLSPVGSSGDVHPFVGIGKRLAGRGHEVLLASSEPFAEVARAAGLSFVSTWSAEEYFRITHDPDLWHPIRGPQLVFRLARTYLRRGYEAVAAAWEPGMVLVGHPLSFASRLLEESRGAPGATLHLAPNSIRSDYGHFAVEPGRDLARLPRWARRAFFWLVDRLLIDRHLAPAINEVGRELGLPPARRIFKSWLNSPRRVIGLFPPFFGPPQPDWPPQARLTGFPLFDETEERPPDPALEAFLAGGEAPIAFTPGSANRQAGTFFAAALEACRRLGRRALLLTSFPEQIPGDLPATALHVPYAPFSRVLPRCAALVHHGGIGTCAQGLAAGIPQLVRPLAFDQPDNAARLRRLGVGSWLRVKDFRAERVAAALGELLASAEVARTCERFRAELAAADPVEATCDLLEELGGG